VPHGQGRGVTYQTLEDDRPSYSQQYCTPASCVQQVAEQLKKWFSIRTPQA
jgi:hypothetical protein